MIKQIEAEDVKDRAEVVDEEVITKKETVCWRERGRHWCEKEHDEAHRLTGRHRE